MMKHPNAATSLVGGTGLGTLLVYLLRLANVELEPEAAAAIAASLGAIVVFVGRNGFLGVWLLLIHGAGEPPAPADQPVPAAPVTPRAPASKAKAKR